MTACSEKLKTFCALKSNAKDANCCIFMKWFVSKAFLITA